MNNFTNTGAPLSLFVVALLILASACGTSAVHPNQLNAFDGSTYDTMVVSHAALQSLATEISTSEPKYKTEYNDAVKAYNAAESVYAAYRVTPSGNQALVVSALALATASVISLEESVQASLNAPANVVVASRAKVLGQRARFSKTIATNMSLTDVLTEIEVGATIAEAIPMAAPYAALAKALIAAAQSALTAAQASSGQPIDMGLIAALPVLP